MKAKKLRIAVVAPPAYVPVIRRMPVSHLHSPASQTGNSFSDTRKELKTDHLFRRAAWFEEHA